MIFYFKFVSFKKIIYILAELGLDSTHKLLSDLCCYWDTFMWKVLRWSWVLFFFDLMFIALMSGWVSILWILWAEIWVFVYTKFCASNMESYIFCQRNTWESHFNNGKYFRSPEPRAQASFSDHNLSVGRGSISFVYFSHFHLFLQNHMNFYLHLFHLLQNHWVNHHKATFGQGLFRLFKWRAMPFFKGR